MVSVPSEHDIDTLRVSLLIKIRTVG